MLCHGNIVCVTAARNRSPVQILNGSLEVQVQGRLTTDALLGKTLFLVNSEAEKGVTNCTECNGID